MASENAIAQMFAIFRELWPKREMTAKTAKIYYLVLSDVSDEDLIYAALDCVENCSFFPVPAEIRSRVKTSSVPSPEAALAMAMDADKLNELPEVVKVTLKNVGGLGAVKERDFSFMRRDFLEAYSEISKIFRQKEDKERYKALIPQIENTINIRRLEAPDGRDS